jgi:hypothetical protein
VITVSRIVLRQVHGLFRRAGIGRSPVGPAAQVELSSGPTGLSLCGLSHDVALQYHQPGELTAERCVLPSQVLEDCEGRRDEPVQIEIGSGPRATVTWRDGNVPQLVEYPLEPADRFEKFPSDPAEWIANQGALIAALRQAADTTDPESSRYALGNVQLRGARGHVASTDGRQALRQSGFSFGVREDLLVPAPHVLQSAVFDDQQSVSVGTAGDWFALRQAAWTVWLRIDRTSRFPRVDDVFPQPERASNTLELSTDDAEFLRQSLGRLPSAELEFPPVTIDLAERLVFRAKDGTGRVTELVMTGSQATGLPVAINANRRLVERAVALGFRRLLVFDPNRVVLCVDGSREYVWMPLDPQGVIPATEGAVRVESTAAHVHAAQSNGVSHNSHEHKELHDREQHRPARASTPRIRRMSDSQANGQPNEEQRQQDARRPKRRSAAAGNPGHDVRPRAANPVGSSVGQSPIQQAEQLHAALREALRQSRELVHTLRRQKKHSRLVQSTLDSLKQLHGVAG